MEVAVVRMSNDITLPVEERRNYKGVTDTTIRIAREEGIAAFWRGSNPFVVRAMMVSESDDHVVILCDRKATCSSKWLTILSYFCFVLKGRRLSSCHSRSIQEYVCTLFRTKAK